MAKVIKKSENKVKKEGKKLSRVYINRLYHPLYFFVGHGLMAWQTELLLMDKVCYWQLQMSKLWITFLAMWRYRIMYHRGYAFG